MNFSQNKYSPCNPQTTYSCYYAQTVNILMQKTWVFLQTCFAFHKSAIGCAVAMAPSTEINYVAEKTSFLVTAKLSMGAVAIDTAGIVDVTCDES